MEKLKTVYNTNKATKALIARNKTEVSLEELSLGGYFEAPIANHVTGVALSDYVGRTPVSELTGGIPHHLYADTATIETIKEGRSIIPIDLITDGIIGLIPYDLTKNGAGSLGFIGSIDSDIRDDGSDIIDESLDFVHKERLINTENKAICEVLIAEKTIRPMAPETVSDIMNGALNSKAKKRSFIITNNSGFAKMDVKDNFGNNLIKKTSDGRFIYNEKYEVVEIDNALLPNLSDGSPVIAGDLASACTLIYNGEGRTLDNDKTGLLTHMFSRRYVDTQGVIALTKSDNCYIVGYLA